MQVLKKNTAEASMEDSTESSQIFRKKSQQTSILDAAKSGTKEHSTKEHSTIINAGSSSAGF